MFNVIEEAYRWDGLQNVDLLERKAPTPHQMLVQKLTVTKPPTSVKTVPLLSRKMRSNIRTTNIFPRFLHVTYERLCKMCKWKKKTKLHESLSSMKMELRAPTRKTKRWKGIFLRWAKIWISRMRTRRLPWRERSGKAAYTVHTP